jgi:cytochrome c peroxidase
VRRWLLFLAALAPAALAFTGAERNAVLSHGPWPPAFVADRSNRVSGNPAAIDLGERLFFDRRLSANGEVSCARCHVPERDWTDGEARALGLARVDRNTPSIVNVRLQRWFGWDGANDSLWAQSIRPLLDAREMGLPAGERRCARARRRGPRMPLPEGVRRRARRGRGGARGRGEGARRVPGDARERPHAVRRFPRRAREGLRRGHREVSGKTRSGD